MLSMTENGWIQLFLFLFLFMSGVACSVVEQSLATAKLRKNSEKTAVCQPFVSNCLKIKPVLRVLRACFVKKCRKVIAVTEKGCIFASALAT